MGKPKDTPPKPESPAAEKMDEAVRKQRDLLAEFEKIADELNRVLANLEGSTLVKRLKAASRLQYKIGGRINDQLGDSFGLGGQQIAAASWKVLGEMAELEGKGSHDVSNIMDDMQSYFERRQFLRFKTVLDEMRKQDVIGSLRSSATTSRRRTASRSPSASSGRTRSTAGPKTWSTPPATASARPSRPTACRRRSCWRSSRSSRRRSTSARRPASPSRPGRR